VRLKSLALILSLLAIAFYGSATAADNTMDPHPEEVPPGCPETINVDPGDYVELNGTNPATYGEGTEYWWTFVDSTLADYPISLSGTPLATPTDYETGILDFDAPTAPGTYYATLNLVYKRDPAGEALGEYACISVTCLKIIVNTPGCPLCDGEWCEGDEPEAVYNSENTTYSGLCPAFIDYLGALPGGSYQLVLLVDSSPITPVNDGTDFVIDWSQFDPGVHTMEFYIADGSGNKVTYYVNNPCTGTVNIVEQPDAGISVTAPS